MALCRTAESAEVAGEEEAKSYREKWRDQLNMALTA